MAIKFLSTVAVDTNVLYVDAAANKVGIGTASPSQKLTVEGDIASQGIYVDRTHESGGISNPFAKLGLHYFWGDANSINLQKTGNNNKFTFSTQSGYLHVVNSSGAKVQIDSSEQSIKSASGTFNVGVAQHATANNNQGNYISITNGGNTTGSRGVINVNGDLKINDYSTSSAIEKIKLKNDGSAYFSGNVGIGTTSPSSKLHVTGATVIDGFTTGSAMALNVGGSNNAQIRTRHVEGKAYNSSSLGELNLNYYSIHNVSMAVGGGDVGIGTTSPSEKLYVAGSIGLNTGQSIKWGAGATKITGIDGSYISFYPNNSEKVRFLANGNVGIGTTSPAKLLEVKSSTAYNSTVRLSTTAHNWDIQGGETGYSSTAFALDYDGTTFFRAMGTTDARFGGGLSVGTINATPPTGGLYVAGNVGIGTTSPSEKLEVTGPIGSTKLTGYKLIFTRNANNEIFTEGASSTLTLGTNSVERMRINSAGNVGIGTTSPSKKLTVNGQTQFYEYSGAHLTNAAHSNFNFDTLANNSSSLSGGSLGAFIKVTASPTGATGTWSAIRSRAYGENTQGGTDNLINFFAEYRNYTSTNAVTLNHHAGLKVQSLGVGGLATVTNNYGVYLDVGTAATNNYGVYQTGASVKNFFQGNVGIGTATPGEKLEVIGKAIIRRTGSATMHADTDLFIADSAATSSTAAVQILGGSAGFSNIQFSDTDNYSQGAIMYGHTDNYMAFKANAAEKMRITSAGNVGIGTTSPSTALHIKSTSAGGGYATIENTVHLAKLQLKSATYTGSLVMDGTGGYISGGGLILDSGTHPKTQFLQGGVSKMIINNGDVGIGTASPSEKLDVAGNAIVRGDIVSRDTYPSIYVDHSGTVMGGIRADATNKLELKTLTTAPLSFQVNSSEKMRIQTNGNVGIGTTSPTRKLDIAESINGLSIPLMVRNTYSGGGRTAAIGFAVTSADQCYGYVGVRREEPTASDNIMAFSVASQPSNSATQSDEKMFITSAGNVGIGTATPSYPFVVKRTGSNVVASFEGDENTYLRIARTGTQSGEAQLRVTNNGNFSITSDSNISLKTGGVSGTTRLYVRNSDGNVGIGTTSPSQKLEVDGEVLSDGYRVSAMQTAPAARNSTGTLGEIRITSNYIYVCYATNSWSRVALATSW